MYSVNIDTLKSREDVLHEQLAVNQNMGNLHKKTHIPEQWNYKVTVFGKTFEGLIPYTDNLVLNDLNEALVHLWHAMLALKSVETEEDRSDIPWCGRIDIGQFVAKEIRNDLLPVIQKFMAGIQQIDLVIEAEENATDENN